MLSKRVPVPIEREPHRSLFSMLEMDEGDAEEMEPAPTSRAYINRAAPPNSAYSATAGARR